MTFQDGGGVRNESLFATGFFRFATTLTVCLCLVAVFVLLTPRRHAGSAPVIDYSMDLAGFVRRAPYHGWVPQGLPGTWQPTSSRVSVGGPVVSWHLAFVTPAGHYAAVEQSNEEGTTFTNRMSNINSSMGMRWIDRVGWEQRYRKEKNQRSLIRRVGTVTLVVTGTASWMELSELASSLHPYPRATPAWKAVRRE